MTCHHPRAQGLSGSAEHIALDVEMWKQAVLINWSCCVDAGTTTTAAARGAVYR